MTDRVFTDSRSLKENPDSGTRVENALISQTPQSTLKNAYLEVEGVLSDLQMLFCRLSDSEVDRVIKRSVLRLQNVNIAINEAELKLNL